MEYTYQKYTFPELEFKTIDLYKLMGYKNIPEDHRITQTVEDVLNTISSTVTANALFGIMKGTLLENAQISIGKTLLSPGKIIANQLTDANCFCIFVTTAGNTFDQYIKYLHKKGLLLEEYVADLIGSYIAEKCVEKIIHKLKESSKGFVSLGYSPGYCGWKLREQMKIFSLLPPNPCGIQLLPSCLMTPIKSTSGIIGIGEKPFPHKYKCELCGYRKCYKYKKY